MDQINYNRAIMGLNAATKAERLQNLRILALKVQQGQIDMTAKGQDVNNHIHTTYSFSPYSPTKAVWMSALSGLATAGIMDHDSISGALEFHEAGRIMGLQTTAGLEIRVKMSDTPLSGKRINNPDQHSIAYVALHGVPASSFDRITNFLMPYREHRNIRNRLMIDRINALLPDPCLALDFDNDVLPLALWAEGGSVTERHLLYALSLKLIAFLGKGLALVQYLKQEMNMSVDEKMMQLLSDPENPYYAYDLLGLLKSSLVSRFYVDATDECPDVKDIVSLANETGSILAYAYLGDVSNSVTGDKKSQTFEDGYLDLLFETIKSLGFHAVTYMPSRNTPSQLARIRKLCAMYALFQVSGEDINSPRQKFICEAMKQPVFNPLKDAAWALIGHEMASENGLDKGMFSQNTCAKLPDLESRIAYFADLNRTNA